MEQPQPLPPVHPEGDVPYAASLQPDLAQVAQQTEEVVVPGPLYHEDDDEIDNSPEGIAERIRKLYGIEKTSVEELIELATKEPESPRFQTFLNDLTYEALELNEEFAKNGKKMRSGKLSPSEQEELRDTQRAIFSSYRQAIIQEAGLPTEAALTEMEKSKQRIQAIVEKSIGDDPDNAGPLKVLEALGIITFDEQHHEAFNYPYGLFPKATDDKWDTYVQTVINDLEVLRAFENHLVSQADKKESDAVRRTAHIAVARDVDVLLGLDQLPESTWNQEETREMLAKMRDTRFPTVETGEKAITQKAVVAGVIGMHALKTLRTRLSDFHRDVRPEDQNVEEN